MFSFSFTLAEVEDCLQKQFALMANRRTGRVTLKDFARYLGLDMTDPLVVHLFNLYDKVKMLFVVKIECNFLI